MLGPWATPEMWAFQTVSAQKHPLAPLEDLLPSVPVLSLQDVPRGSSQAPVGSYLLATVDGSKSRCLTQQNFPRNCDLILSLEMKILALFCQ